MKSKSLIWVLWILLLCRSPLHAGDSTRLGPVPCNIGNTYQTVSNASNAWQRNPSVAYGEGVFLLVWEEGGRESDIHGMILDERGRPVNEEPLVICNAEGNQRDPVVCAGPDGFLAVWSDFRSKRDYDLYGTKISFYGKMSQPNGSAISKGAGNRVWPSLCSIGDAFVAAWSDFRNGRDYDVYMASIPYSASLAHVKEIPVADKNGDLENVSLVQEVRPSVVWDGKRLWMTWLEVLYRNAYVFRSRKLNAAVQLFDEHLEKAKYTSVSTGKRSMAPLPMFAGTVGETPVFLVTQVRYHYQKSVSLLTVSEFDFQNRTFRRFSPYLPDNKEKKNWFDMFEFKPGSAALDNWYLKDTRKGPLSYSYLMAPEVHNCMWTADRGEDHLFVVTEYKNDGIQGLRGWVLKENVTSSPLSPPGFKVNEEFIAAAPAVAAAGKGTALLAYEADRAVNNCVIAWRFIKALPDGK